MTSEFEKRKHFNSQRCAAVAHDPVQRSRQRRSVQGSLQPQRFLKHSSSRAVALGGAGGTASGSAVSCRPSCPRATPATQALEQIMLGQGFSANLKTRCELRTHLERKNRKITKDEELDQTRVGLCSQVAYALGPRKPAVALRLEPDPGESPATAAGVEQHTSLCQAVDTFLAAARKNLGQAGHVRMSIELVEL